jgi:hypothetical protein
MTNITRSRNNGSEGDRDVSPHATALFGKLTLWRDNNAPLFQVATARASFPGRVVFVLVVAFAILSFNAAAASAAPPTVTINPTVTPAYTTAQVSGTVDPADEETYYSFEYSADPSTEGWSFFAYEGPIAAGAGTQNVSTELTGLKPATEYQVRLATRNPTETVEAFSDQPNPTFTTKAVAAPTFSITAPTDVTSNTATFHGQINPKAPEPAPTSPAVEAAFEVHWRFECTPECFFGVVEGTIPADDIADPVTGEATRLLPGHSYEVRLFTENLAGPQTSSAVTFSTPPAPPVVERAFARSVEGTIAEIGAKINPEGAQTSDHFQYVTLAEFEADGFSGAGETAVTPLGTGNADLTALAQITGLSPGVTYVYRAIASNTAGPATGAEAELHTPAPAPPSSGGGCPNESLRAGPSAPLPDCRAYEQVTPTEKSNQDGVFVDAEINPEGGEYMPQVSNDGDRAAYFSFGAFAGSEAPNPFYLATRGTANWGSEGMIPPQGVNHYVIVGCAPQYSAYSPDLARGVLEEGIQSDTLCAADEPPLVPGEPRGVQNLFLRDNATGTYQLINRAPEGVTPANANFQGGSPDLRHVVFNEPAPLTPDATGGQMLYEWSASSVTLVGLIPAPGATSCSGSACIAAEGAELGGNGSGLGETAALVDRAVSENGSRVFFNAEGNLYLRTGDTTREVDVSHGPGPSGGGTFMTASTDENTVLFTDPNQLTPGSSPSGEDLYRYEVGSGQLSDLTPDAGKPGGADVQGVVGASDDASYVYFVANGVLTTAPSSEGKVASEGSCAGGFDTEPCNLYLWHDGATTFIGKTVDTDSDNWNGRSATRVTADGTELAFGSVESLTGYDNTDQITGKPDSEMYLYDAATSSLRCITCRPNGARPMGESRINRTKIRIRSFEPFGGNGFSTNNFSLPRNLSDDGKRLFFESDEALTPADTDGKRDVYEFELVGSGTCTTSTGAYVTAAGGCIYLISTGEGQGGSYFYEASANGDDVFFNTVDQLVGQDVDRFADLYDARVDGGLAGQNPPASPLPCSGDGCKESSTAAPAAQGPGSSTFSGPGNQKKASKPSCKRSKGKRPRCVKKHHKPHKHKKHHKQPKHHKQHRRAK